MTVSLREQPSPNQDDRPEQSPIDMIVLRTLPAPTALALLCDPASRQSAHYLVNGDGTVWRLVTETRRAWHAGPSWWRGRSAIDDRAIGIALTAPPTTDGYPVLQLAVVCDLCLEILSRHQVAPRDTVGQSDIAPERAEDPGATFDWEGLARNGVGLWPADVPDLGTDGAVRDAARLRDVRAALAMIGYRVAPEGALDPALSATLRAFQRHWRPESVNGQADSGTLARLLAVARMVG